MSAATQAAIAAAVAVATPKVQLPPPITSTIAQASPDTIRHNSTESDNNPSEALSILTPDRPQPTLPPRQLAAIALLTSGKTIASVAAVLGVHRSTLHLWKSEPAFAAELHARQCDLADTIDRRLRKLLLHATHTAVASLSIHKADPDAAIRNAFRVMTILRPWMPRLDQLLDTHNVTQTDAPEAPSNTPPRCPDPDPRSACHQTPASPQTPSSPAYE